MNRRIVFDTSSLVSAALRIGSLPHRALVYALATCDLCGSVETLDELDRVLARKKFDLYLDRAARQEFAALIRRHTQLVAASATGMAALSPSCRDPNDNKFLALVHVAEAGTLVSSDEDLLVLNPWNGVAIMTPATFLSTSVTS